MNNNTETRKNKHLNERERYAIELYLKEKYTVTEIAKRLGRHRRTIEREITRGTIYLKEICREREEHELVRYIESKIINEKYSPDAVIGQIKAKGLKFKTSICTKTLYNYIDRGDVFLRLTNKYLPVKKDGKKRIYQRVKKIALKNLKGSSIEERPKEVNDRKEYGHWEMDCVVGRKKSERKTREEIILKLPDKTQESVIKAIDELERKYRRKFREKFKTITVDNGTEFLDYRGIEKSKIEPGKDRTKVYYAHPYSWERGTNENINKLIRRFIPKGTDISKVSKAKIKIQEECLVIIPISNGFTKFCTAFNIAIYILLCGKKMLLTQIPYHATIKYFDNKMAL